MYDQDVFEKWANQNGLLGRTDLILSALRNPHGLPEEIQRGARLAAANLIDQLYKDYAALRDFAESHGVNCTVSN